MSAVVTKQQSPEQIARAEVLISADSHVNEPHDLWVRGLPEMFRDRAPTFPERAGGHPGGYDPHKRLEEMSVDGVSLEVLYATRGMPLFRILEPALQEACFRTFNDWLIDYCRIAPSRLFGIGLISLYDVDHGIQELERCRKAGLRGAMIWQNPPDDLPFRSDHYERFWAAAQDLEMPVSLHILTGHGYMARPGAKEGIEHVRSSVNTKLNEIMDSLYDLMFYGVLDRYPRLKVVLVENEIGWIPWTLQQWDFYLSKGRGEGSKLERRPPEYLGDQLFATFFNDPLGMRYLESWGADACMWSNDFPHSNSTWPDSRRVIAEHLGHLSPEIRSKVLSGNVARLYNIPVPDLPLSS
jgi:predicted TIM-barrel fold metal-dependent hydrolase